MINIYFEGIVSIISNLYHLLLHFSSTYTHQVSLILDFRYLFMPHGLLEKYFVGDIMLGLDNYYTHFTNGEKDSNRDFRSTLCDSIEGGSEILVRSQ